MRTCPNCGHMLSEKDTICFKCGMQLSQIEKPNMGGPMPPRQQMNMNMNNNRPNPNFNKPLMPPKSGGGDNKSVFIVLGVVVVLAILAVVIVLVSKNSKLEEDDTSTTTVEINEKDPEKEVEPTEPTEPEEPVEPEEPEPVTPTEPEQPDPVTPTDPTQPSSGGTECGKAEPTMDQHLVSNNGYTYAVPNEYIEKDYGTQGFDIINYKKTKEMIISINRGTLANLKASLPAVQQMYIDSGAVVAGIKVTTIQGVELICVELKKDGKSMIIGIADAAPGEIFTVAVYNSKSNNFDYDILSEGVIILKTAAKTCDNAVPTANEA